MTPAWITVLLSVAAILLLLRVAFAREIRACFERDPAARSGLEILLAYPGLHALIGYRVAQRSLRGPGES